ERIVDLDLLQTDRALLAGELGKAGDLLDQLALGFAAEREGELGAERQAVEDRGEREADQRRRKRTAEDDDDRVFADEHPQFATQQHHGDDHDGAGHKTQTGGEIHETTPTNPRRSRRPTSARLWRRPY